MSKRVVSINITQQCTWYQHSVNISDASFYPVTLKAEFNNIGGESSDDGKGRCIIVDDVIQKDGLCTDSLLYPTTVSTTTTESYSEVQSPNASSTTSESYNEAQSPNASSTTGIIIAVVFSFGFIIGLVPLLMFFIRRSKFVRKKSANTTMLSNDYIGHQAVASPTLPNPISNNDGYAEMQTKSDNYQHYNLKTSIDTPGRNSAKLDKSMKARNILQANNVTNYDYIYSDKTEAGSTQTSLQVLGVNMFSEEIHKSNEYAVIDPNNYHSIGIDKDIKLATPPASNYVILDPNETGFFRSKGNNKTTTEYDFAVPINDNKHVSDVPDTYKVSESGTYDTTDQLRHKEAEINIYSHAVENVYDTSSHERKIMENDGTYDRFFGNETEDNYIITKRE